MNAVTFYNHPTSEHGITIGIECIAPYKIKPPEILKISFAQEPKQCVECHWKERDTRTSTINSIRRRYSMFHVHKAPAVSSIDFDLEFGFKNKSSFFHSTSKFIEALNFQQDKKDSRDKKTSLLYSLLSLCMLKKLRLRNVSI